MLSCFALWVSCFARRGCQDICVWLRVPILRLDDCVPGVGRRSPHPKTDQASLPLEFVERKAEDEGSR